MKSKDLSSQGMIADLGSIRESLHVAMLKAQAIVLEYGHRSQFTQTEASVICRRSVNTIKEAIAAEKLKTGTSKWIMRQSLRDWLGHDPFEAYVEDITSMQRSLRRLDEELKQMMQIDAQEYPSEVPSKPAA